MLIAGRYICGGDVGIVSVEILDELQHCLCVVPRVRIFQCGQVGFVEGVDELVLKVGVNHPELLVLATLLLVFSETAMILPRRCSFWYSCHSYRVRRADEGSVGDASILIGRKYEP